MSLWSDFSPGPQHGRTHTQPHPAHRGSDEEGRVGLALSGTTVFMTGLVVEEVLTRKRWITFFKTVKCTQFSIYHASGIENSFVSNYVIEAKVVFLSCPGLDMLVIQIPDELLCHHPFTVRNITVLTVCISLQRRRKESLTVLQCLL